MRSRIGVCATPLVLVVLGAVATVRRPESVSALLVMSVGVILALVAAFDYPIRSRYTGTGIERDCLVRRHLIPWDSVAAIESHRRATIAVTITGRRYLLAGTATPTVAHFPTPAGIALRR